jgi:sugar lactone lactonase YvrE
MDRDDPEKRIADLENQLAVQTRGADLPPESPHDDTLMRRFVATAAPPTTKQMMRYSSGLFLMAMASLGVINMALLLGGSLLGSEKVWQMGGAAVFMTFLVLAMPAYGLFQRRVNREKKILIDVRSAGLGVHTMPGGVFAFGDAQLCRWTPAGYSGLTKGIALHLQRGKDRFVLGGRDHRITTGTPLKASPVDSVDAWMWAPEFDELLRVVGQPALDIQAPAPGQPTRCLLVPNLARMFSSSIFGAFKNTAKALSLNANPPQPSLAIDVGDDTISVIDLKSNALIATAAPAQVTAIPAETTRSVPYAGKQTTPVLVVSIPNSQPLTIGCQEMAGAPTATWRGSTKITYRFAWRDEVRSESEPAFVVSEPDWLTLVETFDLAPRLEDRARAEDGGHGDAETTPGGAPLARPKRKLWIFVVIFVVIMFFAGCGMMLAAGNVMDKHQRQSDQVKAAKLHQFALPFTDLRLPHGVAVDAAGNVYVTETRTNRVFELAAGSSTPIVLPFNDLDLYDAGVIDTSTAGVAVDTAGAVYVTDSGHNRVVKLAAGSSTQTMLPFRGLSSPQGVAVDNAGTVYVVDFSHGRIAKLAPGATKQTLLPKSGSLGSPSGEVAVDATANVYITTSHGLLKLAAGSDTWTELPSTAGYEEFVAMDMGGNLYTVMPGDPSNVMKLAPGSSSWTALPGVPSFVDPMGLAVDPHGHYVYIADHTGSRAPGGGLLFGKWPIMKDDARGFVLKLPTG